MTEEKISQPIRAGLYGSGQAPELSVVVRDREGILFDGHAESLTSVNGTGEFDILPFHANFISIIQEKVVIRMSDGSAKTIPLQTGVLRVGKDVVEVFIGVLH